MELHEIRNALSDRIIAKVAKATGLNPHTIYRIKKGKANPNKSTLKLLSTYLGQKNAD
jgi:transcriptional regulator with XRE-family HTH domain